MSCNAPLQKTYDAPATEFSPCRSSLPRTRSCLHAFALVSIVLAVLFCLPFKAIAASPLTQLKKNLVTEQRKAEERRKSLQKLTAEERTLNSDLVAAEKRILALEKGLEEQQKKLTGLSHTDDKAVREYNDILLERKKTEDAQREILRLIWELTCKRTVVGGREMADWAQTDREYAWSQSLYAALEKHRAQLEKQEKQLTAVLDKRKRISRDVTSRLKSVDAEKAHLLKRRMEYSSRLAEVRKKRDTEESELTEILTLVESLNFEIAEQAGNSIKDMKGQLPRPVTGKLQQQYAPQATPASRGIGYAAAEGAEVRAVAGGKVVHNNVLRGFGTVLIVQHGDDYYSLYAFLGSCPLKVGDTVISQQRVGTVGYYPAIKGPGVYFELRFKQKAINPAPWFAR